VAEFLPWMPVIAVLLSGVALWRAFASDRSKANNDRFLAIETKLENKAESSKVGILTAKVDMVEDKVALVQNDLKHLPDKDVTHRLELVIGELRSEVGKLSEQVKPIAHMANRMQEAILEKVMG
jgi:hypothetical protein